MDIEDVIRHSLTRGLWINKLTVFIRHNRMHPVATNSVTIADQSRTDTMGIPLLGFRRQVEIYDEAVSDGSEHHPNPVPPSPSPHLPVEVALGNAINSLRAAQSFHPYLIPAVQALEKALATSTQAALLPGLSVAVRRSLNTSPTLNESIAEAEDSSVEEGGHDSSDGEEEPSVLDERQLGTLSCTGSEVHSASVLSAGGESEAKSPLREASSLEGHGPAGSLNPADNSVEKGSLAGGQGAPTQGQGTGAEQSTSKPHSSSEVRRSTLPPVNPGRAFRKLVPLPSTDPSHKLVPL